MTARLSIALLLLVQLVPAPAAAAAEGGDPDVAAMIEQGNALLQQRRADDAVRAFKKADKLAGGGSAEALLGLALAYNRLGASAKAERAALEALAVAGDAPGLLGPAQNVLGIVLFSAAGDDPEKLAEAEAAFRAALASSGDANPVLKFNLAETLMRQGKDDEALPLLEAYLATDPTGPNAARARSLLDDPRRARENIVPDFSMVALDGRRLTPEDLAGRAVLLDFWGTWCAPCREATPELGRLAERLSDEPFELVAVSNDASREVLERYLAEHDYDWTQVWDRGGEVGRNAFLVRSYPTYLILDHEGRVIYRVSGWGDAIQRDLTRRVHAAVRDARKAAENADAAGGG